MANFYNTTTTSKLDWAMPFHRTGAFPLDRTEIFNSLEDAQLYASGGADSRGDSGTAYPGQIISVVTPSVDAVLYKDGDDIPEGKAIGDIKTPAVLSTVTPYQIQGNGTLLNLLVAGSGADDLLSDPWETYTA